MSNARNLANLLGTGTTIATAKIADDAITAAKIDDDGTGFTVGDLTVGNITSTGVTTGFLSPDSITLDGSSAATVTVNSAVSASATVVVDGVSGTIAVGMVVNVSDTTVRSITDAASQSAISVDDTLTITAVASQTSFTVSEAVTIADNVVLILRADESENFVLDASAASTDVGGKIQFEDATGDVNTILNSGHTGFSGKLTFDNPATFKTASAGAGAIDKSTTASAWIHMNGLSTIAIKQSLNVASITDNGTGNYSITISNNAATADYTVQAQCGASSDSAHTEGALSYAACITDITTSNLGQYACMIYTGTARDSKIFCVNGMGDVA